MTTKKYNQYRNRITRTHGSSNMDLIDKNTVKKILQKLGFKQIQFDQFLCIMYDDWGWGSETYEIKNELTKDESRKYHTIRHPDIISYKDGQILIIEIDGKYHKDLDWDDDYDDIDIPYIKINKEHLKKENISWYGYIIKELEAWDLFFPTHKN